MEGKRKKLKKYSMRHIRRLVHNETNEFLIATQHDSSTEDSDSESRASLRPNPTETIQTEVIKKLNSILHRIKNLENKLEELSEGKKVDSSGIELASMEMDLFPFRSENDVDNFEENCKVDPELIQKCVMALKPLGGDTIGETTVKLLKKIMTNELAEKYSLLGRKKYTFKQLAIYKVIFHTVRVHIKDTTEKEIDPIIARWLVQAKLRRTRSEKSSPTTTSEADVGELC